MTALEKRPAEVLLQLRDATADSGLRDSQFVCCSGDTPMAYRGLERDKGVSDWIFPLKCITDPGTGWNRKHVRREEITSAKFLERLTTPLRAGTPHPK